MSRARALTLRPNRGSDFTSVCEFVRSDGEPFPLDDWTLEVFEPDAVLVGLVTFTKLNSAGGTARLRIEWSNTLLTNTQYNFRLRWLDGEGEEQATQQVTVIYQ